MEMMEKILSKTDLSAGVWHNLSNIAGSEQYLSRK